MGAYLDQLVIFQCEDDREIIPIMGNTDSLDGINQPGQLLDMIFLFRDLLPLTLQMFVIELMILY